MNLKFFFFCFFLCFSFPVFSNFSIPELEIQNKIRSNGSGAEVLYSLHYNVMDADGLWNEKHYYSIRINDRDAARDYGRIAIRYDDFYTNHKLDYARVLTPNGKIKSVEVDAIKKAGIRSSQDFYDDLSEISFSLPHVEPGSIIEFQFTKSTKNLAIETLNSDFSRPHWFQPMVGADGWRADPVRNFEYSRITPEGKTFVNKVYGEFSIRPEITQKGGANIATWKWSDVPEVILESEMQPLYEVSPSIYGVSQDDWSVVDSWFWNKIQPKIDQKSPELNAIVTSLLISDSSEIEKIKKVYEYVQSNIRYVYAHVGRGGYDPHAPVRTLREKYGDCKDQTVLVLSLLNAIGIEAFPLLVETPRGGRSDIELPGLIFDHVMVYIPRTESRNAILLDTTGDRQLFPGVTSYLHGQPAFIVNGKGGEFYDVDFSKEEISSRLKMKYFLDSDNASNVEVSLHYFGVFEQQMRSWWKHANNRETQIKQIFSSIFEDSNQYSLEYSVHNEDALDKEFYINGVFKFNALNEENGVVNFAASASQLFRTFGLASSYQVPESRKNRYISHLGINSVLDVEFLLPKGYQQALLSSIDDIENEYFSLTYEIKESENGYKLIANYSLNPLDLSVAEYKHFYEQLLSVGNQGGWLVTNQKDLQVGDAQKLIQIQRQKGKGSFEYKLLVAKTELDKGNFESALNLAKELVEIKKVSGEAWFILGTAHGYMGDIDKSAEAFDKVKKLGYVP